MRKLASALLLLWGFALLSIATAVPRTDHPRLLITSDDLPALRARANASNPIYAQGLLAAATQARALADAHWDWNTGQPDAGWGDSGWIGNNFSPGGPNQNPTEGYAMLFAFMSLVDDPANRDAWAMRAKAMAMYVIQQAYPGQANLPFRYPNFATYDRANVWLLGLPLTVDWIYAYLSPSEKADIRAVFLRWASEINTATTVVYDHPEPVGLYNDPILLGSGPAQTPAERAAAQFALQYMSNNYALGHLRNLIMLSGVMDVADDPAVDPGIPREQLGNSLGSYMNAAIGAWMYDMYALNEPATTVVAQYNLQGTNPVLGRTSGGFPIEGTLYGFSVEFLAQAVLALDTLGYNDPATYGPQMHLIDSDFWDRKLDYTFHNATPTPHTPLDSNYNWLMPFYSINTYGDTIRAYMDIDDSGLCGIVAWSAQRLGRPNRVNKALWIMTNMLPNGSSGLLGRASANGVTNTYLFSTPIEYFLAFDPQQPALVDPHESLTTGMIDAPLGILSDRTGWSANDTWFGFRCSPERLPHVNGDCMQFEIYRNGEWLTREAAGYVELTRWEVADFHNSLTIQNDDPSGSLANTIWDIAWQYGGQFSEDGAVSDPAVMLSITTDHAFAFADAKGLYNHDGGPWHPDQSVLGVTRADRAILWIKPDVWVIHDRAVTNNPHFKRFSLLFTRPPATNGTTASVNLSSGQTLTIQSLLPAFAALSVDQPSLPYQAAGDETRYRLTVEDPSQPADATFLHVLQATDAGTPPRVAVAVENLGNAMLDGALVGDIAALFPHDPGAPLQNVSYTIAAAVTTQVLTGLMPNTGYSVQVDLTSGGTTVDIAPGGSSQTDSAGVLMISTGSDLIFRDGFE